MTSMTILTEAELREIVTLDLTVVTDAHDAARGRPTQRRAPRPIRLRHRVP